MQLIPKSISYCKIKGIAMEVIYHIKTNMVNSLRDEIISDPTIEEYGLKLDYSRRKGRIKGWASIKHKNPSMHGSIKMEWMRAEKILRCRIITRNDNDPQPLFNIFQEYLIETFGENIEGIDREK